MEKKLSCGFIIQDRKSGLYLGCVPTGSKDGLCDIPKGVLDNENENYLNCALRELREETGITNDQVMNSIEVLGKVEYLKNKDLFLYYAMTDIDLDTLHCDSTFEMYGKEFPEMKAFKLGELDIFRPSMKSAIERALNQTI